MRVGCDASGVSPGWSLLPSSILIVLALVNSDVPHRGTWVSQRDLGVPPHSLTVPLPQDCCAFQLVPVCIMVEATSKWTTWLPPRVFHIWCVTYLRILYYDCMRLYKHSIVFVLIFFFSLWKKCTNHMVIVQEVYRNSTFTIAIQFPYNNHMISICVAQPKRKFIRILYYVTYSCTIVQT